MFDTTIDSIKALRGDTEVIVVKLGDVTGFDTLGRAYVKLYGESAPSSKAYTYIDGYLPEMGDKVAMLPQGRTYIIIGKVTDVKPEQKWALKEHDHDSRYLGIEFADELEDQETHSTVKLDNNVLLPSQNNLIDMGNNASSPKMFKDIYAKKFYKNGEELFNDRLQIISNNATYSLTGTVANGIVTLTPSSNDTWILGTKNAHLKEAFLGLFRGTWKSNQTKERALSWNSSNALVPDASNSVNLGSSTAQFNQVYSKEFYVNGTKLDPGGTVTVDRLTTEYEQNTRTLTLNATSSGTSLVPSSNGTFDLGSSSAKFDTLYGNLDGKIKNGNSYDLSWDNSHNLNPSTTNALSLGTSNKQYKNIYAQNVYNNGTAVSSDRRKKEDITPLDDRYDEFFKALAPVSYKFKEGTSGRTHTGFIAQDVEQAAEEAGLTDKDIAVVVKDKEDNYYLRYEEVIAIQTNIIQKLMARVDSLETKINKLEAERSKP